MKERGGGRTCARDITGKDVRDIEGVTQRQQVRGRETTSESRDKGGAEREITQVRASTSVERAIALRGAGVSEEKRE